MKISIMCMVRALFLLVLANATPVTAADGRFGQALNGRTNAVEVSHNPAFSHWPLAVGMWVRMLDPDGYGLHFSFCWGFSRRPHARNTWRVTHDPRLLWRAGECSRK